jgi:penicillin-insensitive murein DD-endopeptidase
MRVLDHLLEICVAILTLAAVAAGHVPAAFSEQPEKLNEPAPAASKAAPQVQPTLTAPTPGSAAPAKPGELSKKAVAKDLFGAVKEPANMATRSIGFYARGCLAGAKPLPVNGPAWQMMRLSRNRNWGHPSLIHYIERFALDAKAKDRWPGLLVGDLSMPRGGPMPFGHKSHQVGLEADIWYKPAPNYELSAEERETMKMESFLLDPGHVNPAVWKPDYEKFLRRAVSYPEVALIFVHPAIKKWLCDNASGDRRPLSKIIPIMGHDDHFHVRLVCPANNPGCENQKLKIKGDGCGAGLDKWIEALMKAKPSPPEKVVPPKKMGQALTLGQLPPECEAVLKADSVPPASSAAAR